MEYFFIYWSFICKGLQTCYFLFCAVWFFSLYLQWHLVPPALPCSLGSYPSAFFSAPRTSQEHFHLRAFGLATPFAWNILSPAFGMCSSPHIQYPHPHLTLPTLRTPCLCSSWHLAQSAMVLFICSLIYCVFTTQNVNSMMHLCLNPWSLELWHRKHLKNTALSWVPQRIWSLCILGSDPMEEDRGHGSKTVKEERRKGNTNVCSQVVTALGHSRRGTAVKAIFCGTM